MGAVCSCLFPDSGDHRSDKVAQPGIDQCSSRLRRDLLRPLQPNTVAAGHDDQKAQAEGADNCDCPDYLPKEEAGESEDPAHDFQPFCQEYTAASLSQITDEQLWHASSIALA